MENKISFDVKITQKLLAIATHIDKFRGKWEILGQEKNEYLKELRHLATIQSIGSSTRIEGAKLSDVEIESLLNQVHVTAFNSRDEQEVGGYYETLEIILEQYQEIELSETNIKAFHNQLLRYSTKDQRHKGQYKQFSNKVVATYPDGTQRTVFNTTEPFKTPREMEKLVNWTNERFSNQDFHPLFVIGLFVYEFLSIHPFQDGNGRLSRLLTTFLLLKEGYTFAQYISFENIIEERKTKYYRALMSGQQYRYTDQELLDEWMFFFFECLATLTQKLEEKYSRYLRLTGYLNERQQQLLAFIQEKGIIRISDAETFLPDVSISTLKRDLALLIKEDQIEKTGKGRAISYRPKT